MVLGLEVRYLILIFPVHLTVMNLTKVLTEKIFSLQLLLPQNCHVSNPDIHKTFPFQSIVLLEILLHHMNIFLDPLISNLFGNRE